MITTFLNNLTDWLSWIGGTFAYAPVVVFGGLWLLGWWMALCALLGLAGCLRSAPLPFPRPAPIAGTYDLTWHDSRFVVTFLPDGTYHGFHNGRQLWRGTWRLADNIIHVEEWSVEIAGGGVLNWQARIDGVPLGAPRSELRRVK